MPNLETATANPWTVDRWTMGRNGYANVTEIAEATYIGVGGETGLTTGERVFVSRTAYYLPDGRVQASTLMARAAVSVSLWTRVRLSALAF